MMRKFIMLTLLGIAVSGHAEPQGLLSQQTGKGSFVEKSGFSVDQSITQFYGGVASGGRDENSSYSGRWDAVTNFDGQKGGMWPGFFAKMRVGANWQPIERFRVGSILSPYLPAAYPKSDQESIAITDLSVIQMLSPQFGFTAGKIDTFDGDLNSFADGRGITKFENLAFAINPVPAFIPPSTLGVGAFALYQDSTPLASLLVLDTHNVPTTSGFDNLFSEGAVLAFNAEVPVEFCELKGRHRLGYAVSTADTISLNQDPRYVLENGALSTQSNSWAVTYNGEQYLGDDWGLFARAAYSDPDKNIFHYFVSAGIGGTGVLPGREDDRFGLGLFHLEVSQPLSISNTLLSDEEGVELFYDALVLPWLRFAIDTQYLNGTLKGADNALVISGRLRFLL